MNTHPYFRTTRDFLRMSLPDQLVWIMQRGEFVREGVSSLVYKLGELLVVLDVDFEQQRVRDVQAYPAPGVQ